MFKSNSYRKGRIALNAIFLFLHRRNLHHFIFISPDHPPFIDRDTSLPRGFKSFRVCRRRKAPIFPRVSLWNDVILAEYSRDIFLGYTRSVCIENGARYKLGSYMRYEAGTKKREIERR